MEMPDQMLRIVSTLLLKRLAVCSGFIPILAGGAHAAGTKYLLAEAGKRLPVEYVWDVNTATCTLSGVGTLKETTAPRFGTLSYGQEVTGLKPGACGGKPFMAAIAYYTWTGGSANAIDHFTLRYQPERGGAPVDFPIGVAAPAKEPSKDCAKLLDQRIELKVIPDRLGWLGLLSSAPRGRIMAAFTPANQQTLTQAAQTCGFDSFAWTQMIVQIQNRHWGPPPFYDGVSNSESPRKQIPFYYGVGPGWPKGYLFTVGNYRKTAADYCPHGVSNYPNQAGDSTLCFTDQPTAQKNDDVVFITSLVGVTLDGSGAYEASEPLAKWVWEDKIVSSKYQIKTDKGVFSIGCISVMGTSPNIVQHENPARC